MDEESLDKESDEISVSNPVSSSQDITVDSNKSKSDFKKIFPKARAWIAKVLANPKKRLVILASLGGLFLIIVGLGLFFLFNEPRKTSTGVKNDKKTEQAQEVLYPSILDGRMVDAESANRHPVTVIVENHPDARPQSGLDKASIIYEAIAEGGITRYLALFSTYQADKVGPVRSARTFFVDYVHGYNAFFAHAGGSIDGLEKIKANRILDLDHGSAPGPFWREQRAGLASEHTLYTSTARLYEEANKKQYPSANNFSVYHFKDEPAGEAKDTLPDKQNVGIEFSNASYNVSFQYDKSTNSYKRLLAGKPQIDAISKSALEPKNIIVMTVKNRIITNKQNKQVSEMTTVGSGSAKIFIDGKLIEGTWKKTATSDRELFYDEAGNEITFNRGQFWISIVEPGTKVTVE